VSLSNDAGKIIIGQRPDQEAQIVDETKFFRSKQRNWLKARSAWSLRRQTSTKNSSEVFIVYWPKSLFEPNFGQKKTRPLPSEAGNGLAIRV
jgi:hypothetical protein